MKQYMTIQMKIWFFLKPALLSETHKDLIGPVEYLLAFSSESSPI